MFFCSLHNYSSVHGEFYCTSHYKHLFEGKGNHEGFGYKQQKDQPHQNDRGINKLDVSGPKMTKTYLNMPDPSLESLLTPKSFVREVGNASSADVQGKLERIWPPKKNAGFESVQQQTHSTTNMSENLSGNNQSNIPREDQERPKTTPSDLRAEKIPLEKTRSDPPKTGLHPRPSFTGNVVKSTIKTLQQKHEGHVPKTSFSPASSRLDNDPNSGRKSVQFAPGSQTGSKPEGRNTKRSNEGSDKSNSDLASHEFRKGQEKKREEDLEIPKYESQRKTDPNPNFQSSLESDVRLDTPKPDGMLKNKMVEKSKESAKEVLNGHEQSEETDAMPKGSGSPPEPETPGEYKSGEEAGAKKSKNTTENDRENSQKTTNSEGNSANWAEMTKGKLGAWPTGKSPLAKLFTSGGNDKTKQSGAKEARKPDAKPGLLGNLKASSEKVEGATKPPVASGKNDKRQAGDRNTEELKEIRKKEMEDEAAKPDVLSPELKVETEEQPQSAESKTSANDQNPEVPNGKAEPPSEEPEELVDAPKPERDGAETQFLNDAIFNVRSALASGQLSPQATTAESGSSPQLINPSGPDPSTGELPDHGSDASSDLFAPLSSEETFTKTEKDVFSADWTVSKPASASDKTTLKVDNLVPVLDFSHTESQIQSKPQGADMDMFASDDILLFQSPADQKAADTSTNVVDNIFGDSVDVFMSLPPNQGSGNLVEESSTALLLQKDLLTGDILAPEEQMLQSGNHNLLMDTFLMSEPAATSGLTGIGWMDDLLG